MIKLSEINKIRPIGATRPSAAIPCSRTSVGGQTRTVGRNQRTLLYLLDATANVKLHQPSLDQDLERHTG